MDPLILPDGETLPSSPISTEELSRYRASFPLIAEGFAYFNTPTLALLSTPVEKALNQFTNQLKTRASRVWFDEDGWFAQLDTLRRQWARLIGASLHEVALFPSVSAALSSIVNARQYTDKTNVVMAARGEFQTLAPQWTTKGVECRFAVDTAPVGTSLEAFRRVVDTRTAFVATSRVDHDSGYLKDCAGLAQLAHWNDALLLLDDYQAGHLPINVHAQDVDVLVSGAGKWLLGSPGLAFIYVRESLIDQLHPQTTGWFANRNQLSPVTTFSFRDDARKLEMGTPPMFEVASGNAGLAFIEEIGRERIGKRCLALASDLTQRCLEQGWTLRMSEDPARRSAIVCIEMDLPDRAIKQIVVELEKRYRILVGNRPGALRLGLHFFNTDYENAYFVDALTDILDEFIV